MKKIYIFALTAIMVATMAGCGTAKQLRGAYNLTQCKYDYNSVSNVTLAGMDLSQGPSLANIPVIMSILTGSSKSIPMGMIVNLDVKNPNTSAAILHGMQYILNIDGVEFTRGDVSESLNIPGGGEAVLPLSLRFDLVSLMKNQSADAVMNIAKNLAGIGDKKSKITLQLKPTIRIANYPLSVPGYIPVNFEFGGQRR